MNQKPLFSISENYSPVSPRWVIPVLYHSYHLCLWLLYQYHQDEWYLYSITVIIYWYSTVRDISDNCDIVQVSLILMILIQYSQRLTKMSDTCTLSQLSLMSLTVLYQYHQDEWYLYSITVITYVSDCHRHEFKIWIPFTLLDMTTITVIDHGMPLSVLYDLNSLSHPGPHLQ
jgi:hypothetical protein